MLTTKKHIVDQKRLKPGKISIPHSLNQPSSTVCLITPDPQRTFKDAIEDPSFPPSLRAQLRVLGLQKLKSDYKSFESRRRLLSEYDVFLVEDRVLPGLTTYLGKTFYEGPKRPVPVSFAPPRPKAGDKRVKATKETKFVSMPAAMAKEIEKALSSARVHLTPSTSTSVRVGFSNFTVQQLAENIEAVVHAMQEKFITKGWRNIKAIHIKGSQSAALPIWMSNDLWVEEDQVIEDQEAEERKLVDSQKKGTKRQKDRQEGRELAGSKKPKLLGNEDGISAEMKERRARLREQKKAAREAAEKDMGGVKIKKIKQVTVSM